MPASPTPDSPETPLQGKVLYIEDSPVNFAMVEAMLAHHPGVTLIHAESGMEGVRLARSERPDYVLLDMHLPDMSGLEVVRILSKDISERRLRVVNLTVDSLSMDILKAMSLGVHEYWIKPCDINVLEDGVRRALTAARRSSDL